MPRIRPLPNWLKRPADVAALVAVATAGACTLLGFGARYHYRLELLTHFRVQYFWILIAAVLLLVAVRRFGLAIGGAALALVNLVLIEPLYFGPELPAVDRPITRVMSLNVYYHNRRYQPTLELIRAEKPDIVLMLEVTPRWAAAMKELNKEYPYSRVLPKINAGGTALYSKLPLETLSVPGQDVNRMPVNVELPSGKLTLLCAHPSSPSTAIEFQIRNQQLGAMARWASVQTGPLMVLGDLNTTSWSPYFTDFLDESGLVDSRFGFGVQGSWPSLPPPLRIPIDHCLVTPSIAICDRRVGPAVGSDHRPIIVDFTIVQQQRIEP